MATISIEELRIRAALANPSMTSAEVRAEADRVIQTLEAIEFEDRTRAEFAAAQAEQEREQAKAAELRAEAFADAQSIVRRSNPGWSDDSVQREADRLLAENERAIAEMNLREAIEAIKS